MIPALEYRFRAERPWRWVAAGYGADSGGAMSPQFADETAAREFGRAKGWGVAPQPQEP